MWWNNSSNIDILGGRRIRRSRGRVDDDGVVIVIVICL
jgi:hypothetical protein